MMRFAGHALETCAVLSYIKDNESELKQRENYNKYLAKSAFWPIIGNS
jgi:hypothetical protein